MSLRHRFPPKETRYFCIARQMRSDVLAKGAKLDVTIETRDAAHAEDIKTELATDGFRSLRIETAAATE